MLNDISYGIKIWQIFLPFCHNARVCQTDRQTDSFLVASSRWQSMQRRKNWSKHMVLFRILCDNFLHFI